MKRGFLFITSIMFFTAAVFFSCKTNVTEEVSYGKITGKAAYSNVSENENAGILVYLEKTDGLRTASVLNESNTSIERSADGISRSAISSCTTAKDGSYSFESLSAGTYTVYAASSYSAERAVTTNVVVRSNETSIADTLLLVATGSISGKITTQGAADDNMGYLVFVAGTSYMAITDKNGDYTISGVPAGKGYQIVASRNGLLRSINSNVNVNANSTAYMADVSFTSDELETAIKGDDGISMVWLGSFASAQEITAPEKLNAYFNTTDGCSYIYDGTEWELLAQKGTTGEQGDKGVDGVSIVWLGSFSSDAEITTPKNLNAYFNTTDGCSYIYDGTEWKLLAQKGTTGEQGDKGVDGVSIVWLGSFSSASQITNPKALNAYFNTSDGCSYIYNGSEWTLLAKKGADGQSGSGGSAFALATVLSNEELTNEDITITVNLTKSNLSKVGYVYSASSPSFVNANQVLNSNSFVKITPDANGKYTISASANGYYTVAAKDSEGFTAFTQEIVTNIDKTPPAAVTGLSASYSKNAKTITVTWTNPSDLDFDYASLSYTKGGVNVASDVQVTNGIYVLNDVEVDGDEYVFTVKSVDNARNASTSQTARVTPQEGVGVQTITLDRYHFAYNDENQSVTAVATLYNADLIEEGTVVKIQTKDTSGNVTNTTATVNKAAGTATATFTAPSSSNNSTEYGMTYTVLCKIGDEAADTTHTARFNVSAPASLNGLSQSSNGSYYNTNKVQIALANVTSSSTEFVRITGYNLDLTSPCIQLYDSTGTAYFANPIEVDTSEIQWTQTSGSNSQTVDTEIPLPTTDDFYTVKVLFGETVQTSCTRTLRIYDVPKFTNFIIPKVSITKEDNTVTATIVGKNFDTPDADLSNFSATCTSKASIVANTSFTKVSDSVLNATFTIPGTAGDYDITVRYGSESITGMLYAEDYSNFTTQYHVGDVLLNDGTVIPYDANNLTFTDDQKSKAVGVMVIGEGTNQYGVPIAGWLGLYNSAGATNSGSYKWALYETTGYYTYFEDIVCTPSVSYGSGAANTATFTGDTDGSDNWDYICSIDTTGSANAATNYPAFNYANNYGTTFGLTGDYVTGWYMPSLAELCYIYRNKDILNSVLEALNAIQLSSDFYWSSSQDGSDYASGFACYVDFGDGLINGFSKNGSWRVCCMRAF